MRKVATLILVWSLVVLGVVAFQVSDAAAWSCPSGAATKHEARGGVENNEDHIKGTRGAVLVNNFNSDQTRTWRSFAIAKPPTAAYLAETGWYLMEDHGQAPHVYRTWNIAGNGPWTDFDSSITLTESVNHSFKVHDDDANGFWSFAYTNNGGAWTALGNIEIPFNNGLSLTQSERSCTSDTLFAKFRSLDKMSNASSPWTPYDGLSEYPVSAPANDYEFCWLSQTSYDVRGTC